MNLDRAIQAAEAACDAAGGVLRAKFRRELASDMKPDKTIVTEADAAAEAAMRAVLTTAFPDHLVTGEELPPEGDDGGRYEWVLDPIDGTIAFACGKAQFTTLCALLEDGVPVLGVIDQPHARERWIGARGRKTVFKFPRPFPLEGGRAIGPETRSVSSADGMGAADPNAAPGTTPTPDPSPLKGEGSALNFSAIVETVVCQPSRITALADARLGTTDPYLFGPEELKMFEALRARARVTSFGGDGYAYGLLASGHLDVIFESGLSRHDVAALVPILLGAGCAAVDARGVSYEGRALPYVKLGIVAAANAALLADALK